MLARFCPPVAEWFRGVFAAPTPVQQEAWEAISAGEHALVVAPTGSGKTLAAFFVGIEFAGVGTGAVIAYRRPSYRGVVTQGHWCAGAVCIALEGVGRGCGE